MSAELKNVLNTLAEKSGEVRTSQRHGTEYIFIHKHDRLKFLTVICDTFKERGKDKSFFDSTSTQDIIARFLVPDSLTKSWTKSKTRDAHAAVISELNRALAIVWPEDLTEVERVLPEPVPYTPEIKNISTEPPKFFGEDVTESPYGESEVVVDEEFLKLIGAKTNVWK